MMDFRLILDQDFISNGSLDYDMLLLKRVNIRYSDLFTFDLLFLLSSLFPTLLSAGDSTYPQFSSSYRQLSQHPLPIEAPVCVLINGCSDSETRTPS